MKKLLLASFVLVFLAIPAFSQVGFGVHVGGGMVSWDKATDSGIESTSEMGFHVGATVTYPINEKFRVKGNVGYAMFPIADEEGTGYSYSYTLSDIFIEPEVNYMFNEQFYGIAGLGIHMYTAEVEYEYDFMGVTMSGTTDNGETKFGFTVGAGYAFTEKLALEARYQLISDLNQMKLSLFYYFK